MTGKEMDLANGYFTGKQRSMLNQTCWNGGKTYIYIHSVQNITDINLLLHRLKR